MKKLISISIIITALQFTLVFFVSNCFAQASSADRITPLLKGSQVPFARLKDVNSAQKNLKEVLDNKPTVLIFYRGGWCPYCNLQLGELQKIESKLKDLGVKIVAISPDKPEELKKLIKEKTLSYELYSDPDLNTAKAFGIAYRLSSADYKKQLGFSEGFQEMPERTEYLLPVPAAFLVDKNGNIRFKYANANYQIRVSSDDLIAQAQALKEN